MVFLISFVVYLLSCRGKQINLLLGEIDCIFVMTEPHHDRHTLWDLFKCDTYLFHLFASLYSSFSMLYDLSLFSSILSHFVSLFYSHLICYLFLFLSLSLSLFYSILSHFASISLSLLFSLTLSLSLSLFYSIPLTLSLALLSHFVSYWTSDPSLSLFVYVSCLFFHPKNREIDNERNLFRKTFQLQ